MFHWLIGTPFAFNSGACDSLTLWEQIDYESQFTPAKKFFTAVPIALYVDFNLDFLCLLIIPITI